MIERLIFTALTNGITDLQSNLPKLERFFVERHCLSTTEVARIKQYFRDKPPDVIHNYPRKDATFPLYCVVLGNENESTKFLDDTAGFLSAEEALLLEEAGLTGTEIKTSIYTHTHHVMVYTEHPDVTIWYYELAKYFLVRQRDFFKDQGLLDTLFSGQDMAPNAGYAPEWLFVRRLTMSSQSELAVFDDKPERIREVSGVHVDNRVLDVTANVTPYFDDE